MKITLESTTKIIHINGVPARIWEGQTESGIPVHAFVTRIGVNEQENNTEEFRRELEECKKPSPEVEAIPLRMLI